MSSYGALVGMTYESKRLPGDAMRAGDCRRSTPAQKSSSRPSSMDINPFRNRAYWLYWAARSGCIGVRFDSPIEMGREFVYVSLATFLCANPEST